MKQIKLLMCAVVLAFCAMAQANTVSQERLVRKPQAFINTNSKWQAPAYLQMENGVPQLKNASRKAAQLGVPSDTVLASSFGFLQGPDGEDWIFTQEIEVWRREGVMMSNDIKSTTITFYDGNQQLRGSFTLSYDENRSINALEPYGIITKNFFDTNENTYEVLIYEHEAGNAENNYTGTHKTYVYRTNGEKVNEYNDAQNAAVFSVKVNDWTSYDYFLILKEDIYADCTVDVYCKEGWNGLQLKHTFRVPYDNVVNHVGPYFNTYEIDSKPYFTFSYYEKPFYTGEFDENWQMVMSKDNNFIVDVYDGDFKKIDSLKLAKEHSEDYNIMYGFGFLTYDDLSKGLYSGGEDFNFLITIDSYDYLEDEDKFSFYVYNNKGEKIKTIDEDVDAEGIMMLDDVEGHETQWMFGHTAHDGSQSIRFVNIPSCEVVHDVKPTPERPVSFTMNRYADGKDYKYVSFVNAGELDEEENVIARIAWYNQDLTLERFVRFNLGKDGVYFTPNLNRTTLNPYFFNTNDEHEYVYLSYVARESGIGNDTYLTVASANGETIKSYVGDEIKGDIITAGFLNAKNKNAAMYIGYTNLNTGKYTIEFIQLPLTKFAGGDGTKANPYIVNTYGDLEQIANAPAAHYKQGRSIDMSKYAQLWTPIDGFSGSYNGQNYSLENMTISAPLSYYVGLFGELEAGANISNLYIKNPTIKVFDNTLSVGVLAGNAITDTITNVHVYDAIISTEGEPFYPIIGGIVGSASSYSILQLCSFNNGTINVAAAENMGGIVGDARTSTIITACAASGSYTAGSVLGGILGSQGMGAEVSNCHANVNLKAENTIGGIVGANSDRNVIKHNLVEGTIEATTEPMWGGLSVGGILGSLGEDWGQSQTNKIVEGNVVALSKVILPDAVADDKSIHGIVGSTIENAEDQQPGKTYVEHDLANNYITKAILESAVVGDTTVNGAIKELSTMNKEFFTSLGFIYGDSVQGPWVDRTLPILFFEKAAPVFVLGVTLDISEVELFVGITQQLTATINPEDATNKNLIWSTADASVATVENGLITAVAQGRTIITVTTEEGGYIATCNVIVNDDTAVDNVEANSVVKVRKVLQNGAIYIIRTNTLTGAEERFTIDGRKF